MKNTILIILLCCLAFPSLAAGKASDPYAQGRELYLKGKYPEALKLYQAALEKGKKKWVTLQAIGDAYWAMGQKDEGIRYYRMSLKAHPNNPTLKNFLNPPVEPSAAPPVKAEDLQPTPKLLEVSLTGGKALPFQTDHYTVTWDMGWTLNLFLGARISDHLSLGLQADALYPASHYFFPPPPLKPTEYVNPGDQDTFAGNLCLDGHLYPFSAPGNFPVYLVGGGGLYFQRLASRNSTVYDTSTFAITPIDGPTINIIAPSVQWGLGIPFGGPQSKLLVECRMVYVFAVDPIFYVSFNTGGLVFF